MAELVRQETVNLRFRAMAVRVRPNPPNDKPFKDLLKQGTLGVPMSVFSNDDNLQQTVVSCLFGIRK